LFTVQERDRLVTNANDGLWDYDVREHHVFLPRWRAVLGYADAEDIPEWRLLVHPDDLANVQNQLREHLEGRIDLFESVHRMQHANGEWRWIQSRVKGRVDEAKRLKRLVGVETDITERKLYEGALFREGERADHAAVDRATKVVTTDADSACSTRTPSRRSLPVGSRTTQSAGRSTIFRGFHEETCVSRSMNPVAVAMRRNRSIKSVRPRAIDTPRRQRAVHREHGGADSRFGQARHRRCSCSTT
jgi:PAS domain S-box-containing protein